jgi:ADP-ribose pyrophosphatase
MGYETPEWVNLGSYILDPNRGIGTIHLFLALSVLRVAEPNSDDLEEQELLSLTRSEMETALKAGEFKVLAWSTVVAMSLSYLNDSENNKNM